MIDKIIFKLERNGISQEKWIKHFENITFKLRETKYYNSKYYYRACKLLNGESITFNEDSMKFNGSLTKYYKGSNLYNLKPHEIKLAFEKISEDLQIDISNAIIINSEIGLNIETEYSSNVYFPYLRSKDKCYRLIQPESLYFKNGSRKIIIYDKLKEHYKNNKRYLSTLNGNLTRIECTINKLHKHIGDGMPTINNFCKPENLLKYISYLYSEYSNIKKTHYHSNCTLNIKSPKDYFISCAANFILLQGVEKLNSDISILKESNAFDHPNQYYRIKKQANDMLIKYKENSQNTIVSELDNKFKLIIDEYLFDINQLK